MKKIKKSICLLLLGCLWLPAVPLCAQSHLKGLKAVEFSAGFVGPQAHGLLLKGAYNTYLSNKGYYKLSLQADQKSYALEMGSARSSRLLVGAEYLHALLKNRSGSFYFNLSAGGYGGYEHIEANLLSVGLKAAAPSKFVYAASLGVESEIFLKDHLALSLAFKEMYLFNSSLLKFRPYGSLGLKWILLR